jgi:hypothetical protein
MARTRKRQLAAIGWVVMGPDPHLATCQRCGKQESMPALPMPLDALPPLLEHVMLLHALCEEEAS